MIPTSFSIIVCTYNRAEMLANCLGHLEAIRYSDFEILVVNGPSEDQTEDVLDSHPGVRRVSTAAKNISISRNLGLQEARGELVAFIDDDAEAPPEWLHELQKGFSDPLVGGVGGSVVRSDGQIDFQNGLLNRYGQVRAFNAEPGSCNDPRGEWFNTVQGTNCAFRQSALKEVGGFNEVFNYYHDEAEICFRLIQSGWRIVHCPRAVIRHLIAEGPHRKHRFDMNWETVVEASLYFALKSQARQPPFAPRVVAVVALARLRDFTAWLVRGRIGPMLYLRSIRRMLRGVSAGLRLWRKRGSRPSQAQTS